MEIIVSETIGFCSGVKKAINGAEKALKNDENIYCLGDIIHNSGVVNRLKEKGCLKKATSLYNYFVNPLQTLWTFL